MNSEINSDLTSEDSVGTDSSFELNEDEVVGNNINLNSDNNNTLEELKYKHDKYVQYTKRIYQKSKELEQDKSTSMWCSLYYTFFNNFNKKSTITLNELELRCKFLFKMDKIEKEENKKKRAKSHEKNNVITPYTNLNEFIKFFSEKKYDNYMSKIFHKTKSNSLPKEKLKKKKEIKNENQKNNNIIQNNYRLLDMYNITEPVEVINKVTREQVKNDKTRKRDENINYILNNKHAYQVELDNFANEIKGDEKMRNLYNTFLDFKSNDSFFISNQGVDLIQKYGNKLGEQEELGMQINSFCDKIVSKIDPFQKLDF
jgi:hypothetical protein